MQRELASLVAGICGGAMVTVRRISLNGDLSVATVYYTMLAGNAAEVQETLTSQAPRCRKQLADSLNMRATPILVFAPDAEGQVADNIRRFLDNVPLSES
jgi:ribosome-binding factor A